MGPFIYQSRKNGSVIHSFLGKRGLIVYLAALKKGAIRAAHPYDVISREFPPPSLWFIDKGKGELTSLWFIDKGKGALTSLWFIGKGKGGLTSLWFIGKGKGGLTSLWFIDKGKGLR